MVEDLGLGFEDFRILGCKGSRAGVNDVGVKV